MKATINIPDDLLRNAKQRALDGGTTLTAVVAEALARYLEPGPARDAPFRLADGAFKGPLGLVPGVDPTDWSGIRDLIYEGRGA
ncbi:MAG: hypothetical protein KIS66_10140 [Fimbriimonadaceae bacterium]|nr:hypothetical protein [Fimbriimonadaceae bacterium]